ncbi:MAG: hypothetical protein KTR31_20160 [Myxococcales bacterium]|nr:hypothetical protein [Myxococcales bacterium]
MSIRAGLTERLLGEPNPEAWSVYLDHLRDEASPLAELADAEPEAVPSILEAHSREWFGRPASVTLRGATPVCVIEEGEAAVELELALYQGHVRGVKGTAIRPRYPMGSEYDEMALLLGGVLRHLVAQPFGALVRELDVRLRVIPAAALSWFFHARLANLHRCSVGPFRAWSNLPSTDPMWERCPRLETLVVEAAGFEVELGRRELRPAALDPTLLFARERPRIRRVGVKLGGMMDLYVGRVTVAPLLSDLHVEGVLLAYDWATLGSGWVDVCSLDLRRLTSAMTRCADVLDVPSVASCTIAVEVAWLEEQALNHHDLRPALRAWRDANATPLVARRHGQPWDLGP